jgi:hypothetical protein
MHQGLSRKHMEQSKSTSRGLKSGLSAAGMTVLRLGSTFFTLRCTYTGL